MKVAPIPPEEIEEVIPLVAKLRTEVFRDWPYLYDGDLDYELNYLRYYRDSPNAIIVGAWDENRLVGAATGSPMEDHADEFGAPFVRAGYELRDIFYCAESVLLPDYRGRGIGHAFFDHRESAANALGRKLCCFCAVIRPDDHLMKPGNYRPLDDFWRKRGYEPLEGVVAEFSWRDIGETVASTKPLQFWIRSLG